MGCINSSPKAPGSDSDDGSHSLGDNGGQPVQSQKRFSVKNLDDQNTVVGEGEIEVTLTDLVLHSSGAPPVRWPLRYLRRYGFDESLFSFESGRRCPTGEGIYAFSTKQAKTIFSLVENNVRFGPKTGLGEDQEPARSQSVSNGSSRDDKQPSVALPEAPDTPQPSHIAKVQEQKRIKYTQVDLLQSGPVLLSPPVKAQPTPYSEIDFGRGNNGSNGPAKAGGLNYIQVNFAEKEAQAASGAAPVTAVPRTPYADVQPRQPPTGGGVSEERRPSGALSPGGAGGPTEYTPINFKAMQDIQMARMDA